MATASIERGHGPVCRNQGWTANQSFLHDLLFRWIAIRKQGRRLADQFNAATHFEFHKERGHMKPVSYTHLDVYKRQQRHHSLFPHRPKGDAGAVV